MVILRGFLRKCVFLVWCFCGEFVVECVVNVVGNGHFLAAEKWDRVLKFIFWGWVRMNEGEGEMRGSFPFAALEGQDDDVNRQWQRHEQRQRQRQGQRHEQRQGAAEVKLDE
jgi:hypothetical protein